MNWEEHIRVLHRLTGNTHFVFGWTIEVKVSVWQQETSDLYGYKDGHLECSTISGTLNDWLAKHEPLEIVSMARNVRP